jgi:glycyl-tRNA synthetase
MVRMRDDIEGLDAAILMHPRVWEASGHVAGFVDPLVDCKTCRGRFRADKLEDARCPQKPSKRPGEAEQCSLTEPRLFNLMFKTFMGPVEEQAAVVYMRPETAQGIYVNYLNVLQSSRQKVPFGIAQIGKAFRNEITPGNFIFRTREFEQMEIEYFVEPGTDEQWFDTWIDLAWEWFTDLGIKPENIRRFEHPKDSLAHYSKRTIDIEYRFDFVGSEWGELMGVANRTDFDLKTHIEHSGKDLSYFDQNKNERYVPYVIEPSFGLTRALMAFLVDAYDEEQVPNAKGGTDKRTVLHLDPRLAPVKVAVLPLSRNEALSPLARGLADRLRKRRNVDFDDSGAIGRRYRRQDEIGTPLAVTVDFDSLEDDAVTVRDRDTMQQERIPLEGLDRYLAERLREI